MSDTPLHQLIGKAQTWDLMEALQPHLHAAGVRAVEIRIGKPPRFFENLRQRRTMKVRDLFATCSALDLDPVELVRQTVEDRDVPAIRTPRIVSRARARLKKPGPGLGEERLAELETALQSEPRQTRTALGRELGRASGEQLPRLLALYGSCYRVESDLERARVVLGHARDLARELRLPAAEADVLVRLAYVDLERDRLPEAMGLAEKATVISARISDREGEAVGFLTMGMFRYYLKQYQECLDDLSAVLHRSALPRQRIAAHHGSALCWMALHREEEARRAIEAARELAPQVEMWIPGKISWIEAHLASGTERLAHLAAARDALSAKRPADCALVTVELIEEALSMGRQGIAEREIKRACALIEKTGNPQVERAILALTRRDTRLTPELVTKIRQAVETAQARRLSRLIGSDH